MLPSRPKTIPTRTNTRTYFTEALRDYLLNKSDMLGDTYQERYNRLFRGGLRIHTTLDSNLQAGSRGRPQPAPGEHAGIRCGDRVARFARRARCGRWSAARASSPAQRETNMALWPRQTGSSIKFFILAAAVQAGAQPGDIIDGKAPCTLPNPGNEAEPFIITDAVSSGVGHAAPSRRGGRSTVRSAACRRSSACIEWSTRRIGWRESPYLYLGQPTPSAHRSNRSPASPPAPTR